MFIVRRTSDGEALVVSARLKAKRGGGVRHTRVRWHRNEPSSNRNRNPQSPDRNRNIEANAGAYECVGADGEPVRAKTVLALLQALGNFLERKRKVYLCAYLYCIFKFLKPQMK